MERKECGRKGAEAVGDLVRILARLRAPGGCSWDREQTHGSLKHFMLEELGELFDAIEETDDAGIVDELGDLLMHIVFQCRIGQERGAFDLETVARCSCRKMIRRHPHVFADAQAHSPDQVLAQWESIKRRETAARERQGKATQTSALDGAPRHLPALQRAEKIQKRAARVGFDWPTLDGVLAKIEEELAEVREALSHADRDRIGAEVGDLLFAVVNLCRAQGHHAEELLHGTTREFERRFRLMEAALRETDRRPQDCDLAELDALWNEAKRQRSAAAES